VTRFLDRLGTRWQRLSSKVAAGALAHAHHHHAARIFCGHTHAALHKHEHGIDYFNCGAWIDEHPTYITVGDQGVQIHEYIDRPDIDRPEIDRPGDHHPDEEQSSADYEPAAFYAGAKLLEDGEYEAVGR
jgi:hypothetical protein